MRKLFFIVGILSSSHLMAQTHSEKIVRELTFEKKSPDNALIISNISGSITVQAYAGDKIRIEVTKHINAKTQARLEKGIQEVQLGVLDRADTIILYVEGLCHKFERSHKYSGWGYQGQDCGDRECDQQYDYTMHFNVQVPADVHLLVTTVNNGDVVVENTHGTVDAKNVNGNIRLMNLTREASAHTVNGDVDITYTTNPETNCRFYTLNGNINAWFRKGLAANLSFESFNGNFYTNIDRLEALPVSVVKEDTRHGIKYKVKGNHYKAGAGGVALDFETFNGDVYLKLKD
jgi:DUF4097 and DUF4098 domain-containing protein YvlB